MRAPAIAWVPAALAWFALACGAAFGAAADEEQQCIETLQSSADPAAKAQTCERLKAIGSARSVPALGALLADEDLSHAARYALETLDCPAAGAALRQALGKTAGLVRIGIIETLGQRGEPASSAVLAPFLGDADAATAAAAAKALGRIGGPEAEAALKAARAKAPPPLKPALADGLLGCAERRLAAGQTWAAAPLYADLYQSEALPHVRTAAYRGMVLAAGGEAARLMEKALVGTDPSARAAALVLVREVPGFAAGQPGLASALLGESATRAMAALVGRVPPTVRVALLAALGQRGDRAAGPAVQAAVRDGDEAVRRAAMEALVQMGDASAVRVLAEAAARARGAEQEAARAALVRLPGAEADAAIGAMLQKADRAVQVELILALAGRRTKSAIPVWLDLARGGDKIVRLTAVAAVGELGDDTTVAPLLGLLREATAEDLREAVTLALLDIAGRLDRPAEAMGLVAAAHAGAGPPVRGALLQVAGRIGGPEALRMLRDGLKDQDETVRDAAIRSLASCGEAGAAPDLLALARGAAGLTHRVLALRGYLGLVSAGGRPAAERAQMCRAAWQAAARPDEKKLVLAELAKVPHGDALALSEEAMKDEALAGEAEAACVQVAAALAPADPAAMEALRRIARTGRIEAHRKQAAAALKAAEKRPGAKGAAGPPGAAGPASPGEGAAGGGPTPPDDPKPDDRPKAVPLFDGKTFDGWEGNLKMFRIQDGAIVGGTLKERVPRNEFLCTRKTYRDFELGLKVKLLGKGANAGVQVRSARIPNHHEVRGYQADLGQSYWGALYDESRRNRVLARPDPTQLKEVLKEDDWNEYVIRCEGRRIQLWLNGLRTVDYTEADEKVPLEGIIGLQIHGGPPSEAWYKDISIRVFGGERPAPAK